MLSYDELLANAAELTRGIERLAAELVAERERSAELDDALQAAVAAERERCARSISWKQACLAYQGDMQPCSTPCLHCSRIETVLQAAIREGE